MSGLPRVILKPREEGRILSGHPWVYDNEIQSVEGPAPEAGATVDLESSRKRYLGRGYYNPHSKIRVRLLTRSKEGIDRGFWKRRLREALAYRDGIFDPERDSFRLLFAEADAAAGVVVDLYRDGGSEGKGPLVAVVQLLSLGADARREDILGALREVMAPDFVMERSDAPVRALEGLGGPVITADPGTPEAVLIREEGILLRVDLASGQKTGAFLDQRLNRAAVGRLASGRRVLDAFCNSGGFGLQALRGGASSVDFLDSQDEAVASTRINLSLNGQGPETEGGRIRIIQENAFDFLRDAERRKEGYGMVILDPPAFAKSRDQVEGAWRGYKEINMRALSLLEEGGWLVSCSCSHHFSQDLFLSMLAEASRDAGRSLRIAEIRHQSPDHPIRSGYPESHYLKCVMARVG